MGRKKLSQRQLLDSAALTAQGKLSELDNPRFTAYIDGVKVNAVSKPFLVHVRGVEPPFDQQLEPYWKLQRQMKRAK